MPGSPSTILPSSNSRHSGRAWDRTNPRLSWYGDQREADLPEPSQPRDRAGAELVRLLPVYELGEDNTTTLEGDL